MGKGKLEGGALRGSHPKKPKRFKSKESYRKFRAYTHLRTPKGKLAKKKSQTISAKTPRARKEKTIIVAGKRHKPEIS